MFRPAATAAEPAATDGAPDVPAELRPRQLLWRAARVVLVAGVLGLLVVALPGLGGVRDQLADAGPGWLTLAVVAELASAVAYVVVLRGVFCPRLRWAPSLQLGLSELAANSLLPTGGAGGLALGAWSLKRGGMSSSRIAQRTVAFFLVTSAANFGLVIVAGVAVGAGLLPGHGAALLTIVPAVLSAGAMGFVWLLPRMLRRPPMTERPSGGARRERVTGAVAWALCTVRGGILDLRTMRGARRRMAAAGSLGYLAFDVVTLAACLQATGASPTPGDLALAYALGQLGGVVPLPGGLGGTEAGLVGALALYGAPVVPVTAAVLLYRAIQLGVPVLVGLPAFAALRRTLRLPGAFATGCCEGVPG